MKQDADGHGARVHHKRRVVCHKQEASAAPKTGQKNKTNHLRRVEKGVFVVAVLAADIRGHVVLHEYVGHHAVVPGVAVAAHELLAVGGLLGPVQLVERERPIAPARLCLGLCITQAARILNDERSAAYNSGPDLSQWFNV